MNLTSPRVYPCANREAKGASRMSSSSQKPNNSWSPLSPSFRQVQMLSNSGTGRSCQYCLSSCTCERNRVEKPKPPFEIVLKLDQIVGPNLSLRQRSIPSFSSHRNLEIAASLACDSSKTSFCYVVLFFDYQFNDKRFCTFIKSLNLFVLFWTILFR